MISFQDNEVPVTGTIVVVLDDTPEDINGLEVQICEETTTGILFNLFSSIKM